MSKRKTYKEAFREVAGLGRMAADEALRLKAELERRPYWLWRAMLEHVAKQDCEIGCCAEAGVCITEYCVPCAATQFLAEEIAAEAK